MAEPVEVYWLPLRDDGSPDVPGVLDYIYLTPKGSEPITVRFAIEATSSICRHGSLWVNIPEKGAEFKREAFREFKLQPDFNRTIEISVPIHGAGAFSFYTTYSPLPDISLDTHSTEVVKSPLHYIDVSPRLTLRGEQVPLQSLSVFSLLGKFMGKYPDDWDAHLAGIAQRGYNMVHFAPLTERGESNSPYSIYDQNAWDPTCFPNGEADVVSMLEKMESKHGMIGLTDVVWNHTANNSKWLEAHPEVGYNVSTAPHLRSALEFDTACLEFSENLAHYGLPTHFRSVDDLMKVLDGVKNIVITNIKLWEFYVLNVGREIDAVIAAWEKGDIDSNLADYEWLKTASEFQQADFIRGKAVVGAESLGVRFKKTINVKIAASVLEVIHGKYDQVKVDSVKKHYNSVLDKINLPYYKEFDADVAEALQQMFYRIKFLRIDDHGPKLGPITDKSPLIETYFTRLAKNEMTKKHKQEDLALVNNGWIWATDGALFDSAGPQSRAYLRREVIIWGDCVKLRYGSGPEDSPYLWDFMAQYTRKMAKFFRGFRIDNAHSTPIRVAEYLLDEARKIRPDLYVVAELFTESQEMEYMFLKRLGLTSLIREAMQPWDTDALAQLVGKHNGRPIGSFDVANVSSTAGEVVRPITKASILGLFMDCTHDNEVPAQQRDARDTLATAGLVAMSATPIGSVMGYDEIYHKIVDLVNEKRLYTSPFSRETIEDGAGEGGIGGVKRILNRMHDKMGREGYSETFLDRQADFITIHRVHPVTRKGYFLISHSAWPKDGEGSSSVFDMSSLKSSNSSQWLQPVHLVGTKVKAVGCWSLQVDQSGDAKRKAHEAAALVGLPARVVNTDGVKVDENDFETILTLTGNFPKGTIALFETWMPSTDASLEEFATSGAEEAFSKVDLIDLNFILYRCEAEERDASEGKDGVYEVPGHGKLVYAGLQGFWSPLQKIIDANDLGHPLCQNLRGGHWALDFISARLEKAQSMPEYQKLAAPAKWLMERFEAIKKVPSYLLPRLFALVVRSAYDAAWARGLSLMNENVQKGQWFLQSLAMTSVQQQGRVKSASLYPKKSVPALAAGLPHFTVDWARCWGRDVFISARGLFLGTGRYEECKEHIKAFASVLKHGQVPNLLSSGWDPRYNARDAVWFMLQTIQDYTEIVPNGIDILKEEIPRRFLPYDDTYFNGMDPRAHSVSCTLEDIIQEALQRHASGIKFREANAGPGIDMQMKSEGFDQDIHVDWSTGIIFGGSQTNCGTWMDKMGESEQAHSKGVPGSPRDGAAVEITGLHYSAIEWLSRLHKQGKFKYEGVDTSDSTLKKISYADWASLVKKNFERCFYIPLDAADDSKYDINPAVVNRRGVYKDVYKSGKEYEDYQFRCNFPIAMTVAPDLFDPQHAFYCLTLADKVLRGPVGMATLDPSDWNYRPNYNNSEDSTDFATSKGRNYHNGPEWVWPTGFFLRALLKFDLKRRTDNEGKIEALQQVTRRLAGCKQAIKDSPWAGLTELTNKNGSFCKDSSPSQAWSTSCLIDLYQDAAQVSI